MASRCASPSSATRAPNWPRWWRRSEPSSTRSSPATSSSSPSSRQRGAVMTTEASVPVLSPTFFEPGFNQAPFPLLEEIRALGPVVFNEVLDGYMITGYRDVARILGDVPHYAQAQSDSFDS